MKPERLSTVSEMQFKKFSSWFGKLFKIYCEMRHRKLNMFFVNSWMICG